MKNKTTLFITQSAVIAALYVALTYVSNAVGLAYGGVQFRLSEILTLLPVFTPAAIPGLTIGCVIANITSPYGLLDIIAGSLASLIAAILTRALRKIEFKNIPFLSSLPPIICNAVIVGLEIWYLGDKTAALFFISAGEVALGEAVMCIAAGLPFVRAVKKTRLFERMGH